MSKMTGEQFFHRLLLWLKNSTMASLFFPKEIEKQLYALGENHEQYYLKKFKLSGGLLLIGIFLLMGYVVWYRFGSLLLVEEISRPEAYEKSSEITVEMIPGGESYQIELLPRELSKEQADDLFDELSLKLDDIIRADNQSLEQVTSHLFLPEYIEFYPFDIYWESDKEYIIDTIGTVNRYGLRQDEIVIITGMFYYQDWVWELQFAVCVVKEEVSQEEIYRRDVEKLLQESEFSQRGDSVFQLPIALGDNKLLYGIRQNKDSILFLACLIVATAVILWLGQDNDLRIQHNRNKAVFEREYASFICNISMYISAGITLPVAMNLIVKGYKDRKLSGDIFFDALLDFSKDIQNGQSFSQAMNRFADKADIPCYKRLAGILSQSMINGSRGLANTLEAEVIKIQEENYRKSKVKGEQVSAALIAPMMLQLGVVIALVMIPAFMNMQF